MAEVGIRKWLKDNGYASNDDDITYNNGTVYLKGRQFTNATPGADGSTYADSSNLANAYKAYQSQGLMNEVNDTLSAFKSKMNQPRQAFSFDPNTDQQYQSALAQARSQAQSATNNTLAQLRGRGQGKSSYSETVANQIQQKAVADVTANQLPQMIAQAYQRYMGEQQLNQQDIGNIGNYLGYANNLYQQGQDNDYRDKTFAETQKQNNLDLAKWGVQTYGYGDPKSDAGVFFNQYNGAKTLAQQQMDTQNSQWQQTFDYGKERDSVSDSQWNKQFSADQSYRGAQLANAQADNARAAESQRVSQLMDIWRNTGVAPAGIPGVAQGTPITSANSKQIADMTAEKQGLVASLRDGSISPAAALQQIEEDTRFGFYTPGQAQELKSIIQSMASSGSASAGAATLTKEQADAMPSAAQLDQLYQQQGAPIGAPELDWKSWYKDPKGRVAGVDFARWKQLYGPKLSGK